MLPILIGIVSGLITVFLVNTLGLLDRKIIYGLILSGIGFLYVGFSWSNTAALILTAIQAFVFLLIAYRGSRNGLTILAVGYFLHGVWDIAYNLHPAADLIPPQYDLFCFSIDFTIGLYLVKIRYLNRKTGV